MSRFWRGGGGLRERGEASQMDRKEGNEGNEGNEALKKLRNSIWEVLPGV